MIRNHIISKQNTLSLNFVTLGFKMFIIHLLLHQFEVLRGLGMEIVSLDVYQNIEFFDSRMGRCGPFVLVRDHSKNSMEQYGAVSTVF